MQSKEITGTELAAQNHRILEACKKKQYSLQDANQHHVPQGKR
jgi:hypothetical protein